jgi:hypothetical protein
VPKPELRGGTGTKNAASDVSEGAKGNSIGDGHVALTISSDHIPNPDALDSRYLLGGRHRLKCGKTEHCHRAADQKAFLHLIPSSIFRSPSDRRGGLATTEQMHIPPAAGRTPIPFASKMPYVYVTLETLRT